MPGLASDQATLDEILEVRAEPLTEQELWSVLLECGNALKSILSKTDQERLLHLSLTLRPDTILLCLNGKVKFAITKHAKANKNFIAPESFSVEGRCTILKIEKMLVYCLGMTALAAAENGLDADMDLQLSRKLENLLNEMVEDNCARRCSVSDVIQSCKRQVDLQDCYKQIRLLAMEIVGPYGLQPLSKFPSLPEPPSSKRDKTFNGSVEALLPLSNLPPVAGNRKHGRSKDMTDGSIETPTQTKRKPPLMKNNMTPRSIDHNKPRQVDEESVQSKPWSPTYSSPDLKTLLDMENEKLKTSGYLREQPRLLFSPNKSLSMPSLNDVDDTASEKDFNTPSRSRPNSEYKSQQQYRSTGFINRANSITSYNSSSQMSLTHGAYVLDSDPVSWPSEFTMKRYNSGSSMTNSGTGIQSNFNLPLRPPEQLDLKKLGPEFVRITEDPDKALIDITPPRLGPLPKGTRRISVNLPNNQQVQLNVQVSSKAKDVFDQIVKHLSLKETSLFGLTYVKDGEELFLEFDTKLTKYAPTGWKDENSKKKKVDFILFFRVKYFLQDPRMLKHCLTIHLYYLQLRQFLLSGYIQCPDDILINLTSYALQAEYGDFLPQYQGVEYFKKEFYIPGKVLSRLNRIDLLRNLPMLHKSRQGMSTEEAELAFLNEAACLSEYGVLFHKVSRSKKNESDYVWLGIRIKGIVVLEPKGLQRSTIHEQTWDLIKEFTFEKKKFVLKPKKPDEDQKLVFYTNHYRKSKYLFKLCQSFHRFELFNFSTRMNQVITRPIVHKDKNSPTFQHHPTSKDTLKEQRKINFIQLEKQANESLGLVIVGGEGSKRLTPGIYIKHIKPNSVCKRDGRLNEGDRIISVNGISLEESTHEQAAEILKRAGNKLDLVVSKTPNNVSLLEKSGLSPSMDNSQVIRYKNWDSVLGENNEELKKKLSGIDLVDDDTESEEQFSERAIDVPVTGSRDDQLEVQQTSYQQPSSEYDDPAQLERTMDDIAHDLAMDAIQERIQDVEDGKRDSTTASTKSQSLKQSTSDKNEDRSHVNSTFPAHSSAQHSPPQGEEITPRANVVVNDVEISQGDDDFSFMTESDLDEEKPSSNLKRFGAFQALDRLDADEPSSSCAHEEDDERSLVNRTLDQTLDEVEVEIEKINGSFGFSVQGGKESNLPLGSIYVKQVYPNGAAARTKRIRDGDRLLAVNGTSLENIKHQEAVTLLKEAPNKSVITFDRGIELPDEPQKEPEQPVNEEIERLRKDEKVFEVNVEKRENGLGLSLAGGKDSDICYGEKIMIRKLFPGYALHECGRFLVGDVILAINDQVMEGLTYQEAIAVIRTSPKMVTIIAKRPQRDEIPSELFETSRPVSPEKLLKDSKLLQISGRSASREGHRLAKELLQSLHDVDETSIDIPLSSIIAHSQLDDIEGGFSDEDVGDENFPEDDDDDDAVSFSKDHSKISKNSEKNVQGDSTDKQNEISIGVESSKISSSVDYTEKSKWSNGEDENTEAQGESEEEEVVERDFNCKEVKAVSKFDWSDLEDSNAEDDERDSPYGQNYGGDTYTMDSLNIQDDMEESTHSIIGKPRRRPVQKQNPVEEVTIEMKAKQQDFKTNDEKQVQESKFITTPGDEKGEEPESTKPKVPATRTEKIEQFSIDSKDTKQKEQQPRAQQIEESPMTSTIIPQQETQFMASPRRQPSPALYPPSSPGALKNLNANSHQQPPALHRQYSSPSKTSSTGEIISIQLEKGSKGLGITLATDEAIDDDSFVYIKRLVPGSVADLNGLLKPGDRIITVNGANVEDLTQKEIINIFRQLSGTVSMEFFRPPDLTPSHKRYTSDDNSNLTLPRTPSVSPKKEQPKQFILQNDQQEVVPLNILNSNIPASSSTPFELSDKIGVSEEVTFNSNDGLSFADSLLASDGDNSLEEELPAAPIPAAPKVLVEGHERLLQMTSPPVAAAPYVGDSDSESTHNEHSQLEGFDEYGIYNEDKYLHQLPPKNPTSSIRPLSGTSSIRSSTRSASGIPRPIRSRSNSLHSSDSGGGQSRRNSTEDHNRPPPPRVILDKSFDSFIQRKDFKFYTPGVVNTVLLSLDKKMAVNNINAEFMALRQIKCLDTCDVGNRASNRSKNRVKTILPYDKNRVQLAGGEESDYINASHVKLPLDGSKPSQYIITQAPLELTVCDFWRCVWEKKVEVIVMLTREEENSKIKCHKYWPSVKKTPMKLMDKFTVELLYEEFNGSYIYRQIQIHNVKMDKSLFITQACFTQWPETGVPKDAIEFLGFMKFVRNFSSSSTTVVHCSVGVGRSGIYVVLDAIWNSVEQDTKIDIAKMIQQAKEQRQLLIQTKEQYSFIYQAAKELFQDLDSTLTVRS